MAKPKTAYVCSECGATALQWFGACPSCGAAGTLTETSTERGSVRSNRAAAPAISLADVRPRDQERMATGIGSPVTLWGEGLSADEVGAASATLSYELFCKVTARVAIAEVP